MPKKSRQNYPTVREAKASGKPRVAVAPHIQFDTVTEKYIVDFFSGWKSDSKAIRKSKTFDSLKEAKDALTIHEAEQLMLKTDGERMSLGELIEKYIATKEKTGQIAPTTAQMYANLYKRISLHPIVHTKIGALHSGHVDKYAVDALDYRDRRGNPYSPNTIRKDICFIQAVMDYAASECHYIKANPITKSGKKIKKIKPEIDTLSIDEINTLFQALTDSKDWEITVAACLCVYQGLRRGECCGLTWDAISFEDNTISITETRTRAHTIVDKAPKSESSIRLVDMHPKVRDILMMYRDIQIERGGVKEYVLISPYTGQRVDPSRLSCRFADFISKTKCVKPVTLHELRHTYATIAITHGVDVSSVSKSLGHGDIQTTLGMYTHPTADSSRRVNNILSKII